MKKALFISCFSAWYIKRLEPVKNILKNNGYQVKIVVSDFEHVGHKPVSERNKNCIYFHVPEYRSNISIARIRSHFSFGRQVQKYIDRYQPDLLYLVVPPNNSAVYCNQYKKKIRIAGIL